MCGIIGFVGYTQAEDILLEGLRALEYRGYDSAGICVGDDEGVLQLRKAMGRLDNLEAILSQNQTTGTLGIGHTRWATHGEPSERNCHPHVGPGGTVSVVHNGIIENYKSLRGDLSSAGATFQSETDTETIPHLVQRQLDRGATGLLALQNALNEVQGAYAIGLMIAGEADTLYAARMGSPLVIAEGDDGLFIASDPHAVSAHIERVIYLDDGQIASLHRGNGAEKGTGAPRVEIRDLKGADVSPEWNAWEVKTEIADRGGFETYMLKEIHEQPRVLRGLADRYTRGDRVSLQTGDLNFTNIGRILIVSCGSAYFAGSYARLILQYLTKLPVQIELGSEFRYAHQNLRPDDLILAVSQSGETADTLASVRKAKSLGCKLLAICNVEGSSLDRESDLTLLTHAGPEIGVASTKAFVAQLYMGALLGVLAADQRGEITAQKRLAFLTALRRVPDLIHQLLGTKDYIRMVAERHHDGPSSLYLGRRFNVPIAMEGALKNKEVSYQHAEGYAAGELKHGPIALVSKYLPVVCICTETEDEVYEKMMSNVSEIAARHGRLIILATEGDSHAEDLAEDIIWVPRITEPLSPLINVVALQLLAYYSAKARGTDIDKPRNLAKSVTVE